MATLTLRSVKGAPLTNTEVDNNFANLNIDIGVLTNLNTTAKANIVEAINELSNTAVDGNKIIDGTTLMIVTATDGPISANIDGTQVMTISKDGLSTGNIFIFGNLQATVVTTNNLRDSSGRTLQILDESNTVIWGN